MWWWTRADIIVLGGLICAAAASAAGDPGPGTAVPTSPPPEPEEEDDFDEDWDDGAIWGDYQEPPKNWGEEHDLPPDQLGLQSCLSELDLAPNIQMPMKLTRDMFVAADQQATTQGTNLLQKAFSPLTSALNSLGMKQQLDTVSTKLQAMIANFLKIKSLAAQSVREKLDKLMGSIGKSIQDHSGGFVCNEKMKKCLDDTKKSSEQLQKELQSKMDPCLQKIGGVVRQHDGDIKSSRAEVVNLMGQLKECAGKLTSGGFPDFAAMIGSVSCTASAFNGQFQDNLMPKFNKLMDLIKKTLKLQQKVDKEAECIDTNAAQVPLDALKEKIAQCTAVKMK